MSGRQRRYLQVVLATAMAALVAASIAWACTPDADIDITPSSLPPGGGSVDVNGAKFVDGSPIEVRWNAVDGPLLATTTARGTPSGMFSVTVATPKVPADAYTVVVVGRDANENPVVERAQLVVGQAAATPSSPSERSSDRPAELSGAEPRSQADDPPRASADTGSTAPRSQTTAGDAAAPAATATAGSDPAPARGGDSGTAPDTATADRNRARDTKGQPAPTARSATGDLWSGFSASKPPIATASPDDAPAAVGGGSSSPHLAIGVGLLGIGLVVLMGAATLAQLRRRATVHKP